MTTKHSYRKGGLVALVAAVAALSTPISPVTASGIAAASPGAARLLPDQSFNLCARTGTTMIGATSIPVWGYNDCASLTVDKPGGPVLTVTAGDVVEVVLHNDLGVTPAENTALLFQGQAIPPDTTGAVPGSTQTYTFTAAEPGTYLYEAGLTPNSQHQVAMGLYGALVVRPAGFPLQAYDSASTTASTAFDDEGVLVLGEIDTALNKVGVDKTTFDMRKFKAKYFTINGKAYSTTDPIATTAGNKVLLRYVNAGMSYHSMSLLGGSQQIIGYDGNPLKYPHRVAAESFGPGQTVDALVSISPASPDGTKLAIYDANLLLNNSATSGFGGMMTFITVGAVVTGDTTGPLVTAVSTSPNPTNGSVPVTLTASATDPSTVAAAEYRIDGGPPVAFANTFGTGTVALSATITAPAGEGNHSIEVRAQDALLNWSGWSGTTLVIDSIAPAVTGLALTPNPSSGSVDVAVHAAATDANAVVAAEYQLDGGTPVPFAVAPASPVSLDKVIPGPFTSGPHTVSVRARDAALNWSPPSTISLIVDTAGPVTSTVSAAPNPTNGVVGVNLTTPAVRVSASATDADANVVAAEGFIDTVGSPGTGFLFVPADGAWTSHTEAVTADIPLSTINSLSNANHTIFVRSKDAVGNWGVTATTTLVVDKVVPVVNNPLTATPNPASTTVTLGATGTDNFTGVNRVEWFTGTDPGRGLASAMTVTGTTVWVATASIDVSTWASGNYTLSVRARDGAQNWSSIRTIAVAVSRGQLYFSTLGNTNPPNLPFPAGTADDADIYGWNGTFGRTVDVSAITNAVPGGANVDGLEYTDATHFYLSFAADTGLPALGTVQDEDIVEYSAGAWSVYFDGTSHGLGASANQDIDAFAIVGTDLYYSTVGNTNPTGLAGTADDADIYLWNGTLTSRFWDATTNGVLAAANVDGIAVIDSTHFYLSFAANTTVTGLGAVQDEDVVKFSAGTWSTWFDGTSLGLTSDSQDLDAIDVP